MKYFLVATVTLGLSGCVTSTNGLQPEYEASRVIERITGSKDTPEWATGQTPFFEERGEIIYANTLSMSGDARPEACTRAASDLGRVQILREVRDNITASGQFNELSASTDPAVETLIAFLSQGKLSGVKVVGRYWERREESDSRGLRVLRLHCAAKVSISRALLERQLQAAIDGPGAGNPEIRQKLLDAQKGFLDAISDQTNIKSH